MRSSALVACSALCFLSGCPTRDQISNLDADANGIAITAPSAPVYTKASITIDVSTSESASGPISIVASDVVVGTIDPPQKSFDWDTTGVDEGDYSVTARMTTSSGTITSDAVTITVDRTPPMIAQNGLTPAPNATNVVLAEPLTITFSEPVLRSSVRNSFVALEAGQTALSTTVTLNSEGTTATATIGSHAALTLPQTFSASFGAGVTDRAGNPFVPPDPGSWQWTVPDWVKLAPFDTNGPPVLAVGSDFHPAILYSICTFNPSGCASHLHVAMNVGQGWNDLGEPAPDVLSTGASLALDSQNRPIIATTASTGTGAQAVLFSWTGSVWDRSSFAPIDVPSAAGYYVDATGIHLDSSGKPVVAYRANTPTSSDVYVARWTGSAWDSSYGGAGLSGMQPFDFILDDQDQPIIGTTSPLNGVTRWSGSVWTKSAVAGAQTPFVALDSLAAPMMVTSNWRIAHFTGGSWLPNVPTPVPVGTSARNARITATPDRQPVVAWQEPTPTPGHVGVARWTGSQWDVRGGLVNSGGPNSPNDGAPAVTVDARGSIWIAWSENNTSYVWMSNY